MPRPHGTINRYNNQRCRCDACRIAIRNYRRAQRANANVDRAAHMPAAVKPQQVPASVVVVVPNPTGNFQVVRASCGHILWFPSNITIPLGGWILCPQHRLTSAPGIRRVSAIPSDALPGLVRGLLDD